MYTYVNENALKSYCEYLFCQCGVAEFYARVATDLLVCADRRGVYSHGVCRLPTYIDKLRNGGTSVQDQITILKDSSLTAMLDANHALGSTASYQAVLLARNKAAKYGLSYIVVKNSSHYGMAAYWSLQLAQNDMIGFTASNSEPCMATYGGKSASIGNNPFSIALSGHKYKNICLDIACSVAAGGKKDRYKMENRRMPRGWFIDSGGNETDNPYEGIIALPFGGHKGSGLSFVMEVLTSLLAGGHFGEGMGRFPGKSSETNKISHCFAAMKIDAFQELSVFREKLDDYIDYIKSSEPINSSEEIFYPGEIENRNEERHHTLGVPVSCFVLKDLYAVGQAVGLSQGAIEIWKRQIEESEK